MVLQGVTGSDEPIASFRVGSRREAVELLLKVQRQRAGVYMFWEECFATFLEKGNQNFYSTVLSSTTQKFVELSAGVREMAECLEEGESEGEEAVERKALAQLLRDLQALEKEKLTATVAKQSALSERQTEAASEVSQMASGDLMPISDAESPKLRGVQQDLQRIITGINDLLQDARYHL